LIATSTHFFQNLCVARVPVFMFTNFASANQKSPSRDGRIQDSGRFRVHACLLGKFTRTYSSNPPSWQGHSGCSI